VKSIFFFVRFKGDGNFGNSSSLFSLPNKSQISTSLNSYIAEELIEIVMDEAIPTTILISEELP
jgi:hypothetical protein